MSKGGLVLVLGRGLHSYLRSAKGDDGISCLGNRWIQMNSRFWVVDFKVKKTLVCNGQHIQYQSYLNSQWERCIDTLSWLATRCRLHNHKAKQEFSAFHCMLVAPGQKADWQVDGRSRGEKNDTKTAGNSGVGGVCEGVSPLARCCEKQSLGLFFFGIHCSISLGFVCCLLWEQRYLTS